MQQRLLDHLKENGLFCAKDLDSIEGTLVSLRENLRRGQDTYSPQLLTVIQNRIDTCHHILEELMVSVTNLSSELVPVHEKLISIVRSLAAANTRSKVFYYYQDA